jgi:cyclopropane fatty-acyl-phospholipid synthase-like methyltransferase
MSQEELDRWQQRFSAPGYLFGTAPNAFLKAQAHRLRQGQSALAIADGEGRNGVFLAEQGLDVLSIDFSAAAQDKVRKLAAERNVTLRVEQADVINWTYPSEAFDVVAAIFIQFATPAERDKIFAGIKKTLKPGGLLLIEGYGLKQLEYKTGGPSKVENLYTRAMLEQAFGDFTSLDIREHDSDIREGDGHGGLSALIDVVGVK